LILRTIRTFENFRPLVIRIDDLGRAEAINYTTFEYKPQDAEAKYFSLAFCSLYYRRNALHDSERFRESLFFLDGKLATVVERAELREKILASASCGLYSKW